MIPEIKSRKINELYCYITDTKAGEGFLAMNMNGNKTPMIFPTLAMAQKFRPTAKAIGKELKLRISLVKYTVRNELEAIGFLDTIS